MNIINIIVVSLLLAGATINQSWAQKSDADITVTKVIDASADKVWTKIRQMDDIEKYSSAIAKVK